MPSPDLRALLLILALALAVRLPLAAAVQAYLSQTPGRLCLVAGDAEGYWHLARQIARGRPYEIYDPPRRVLRMPGFPLLLSGTFSVFGESPLAARLMQAVCGALACGCVYALGRTLADGSLGFTAGLFAALSPALAGGSVLLLSETPFALALLASLWSIAGNVTPLPRSLSTTVDGLGWGRSGLLIGLATLIRPTWILIAGIVPLLWGVDQLARGGRVQTVVAATLIRGGWLLLATGLVLAPWTIRNAMVTGHFVPTTLWVGPSLYDGLNPRATGASDMTFIETDRVYTRLSEYDADRHYRDAAWTWMTEHPARAAELAVVKLWRFLRPWPAAGELGPLPVRLAIGAWSVLLFGLAALGLVRGRPGFWLLAFSLGPLLYFAAIHTLFVGSLRYRLPAEYPLCVLAALGWRGLPISARWRGLRRDAALSTA